MFNVHNKKGISLDIISDSDNSVTLKEILLENNLEGKVYVTCNGRVVSLQDCLQHGFVYHVIPRVLGGKGGFGSMLRAIGAQIEKTTNREACRDLSGRRMRDVNNEQQLRDWVKQKSEREREKEEKRKERAEKRKRALTESKHHFDDQDYHRQKMQVLEKLEDALTQGLQKSESDAATAAASSSAQKSSRKRKANQPGPEAMKKACEWLGVDAANLEDLSDSGSDSDSTSDIDESDNSDADSFATLQQNQPSTSKQPVAEVCGESAAEDLSSDKQQEIEPSTHKDKQLEKPGLLSTLSSLPLRSDTKALGTEAKPKTDTKQVENSVDPEKPVDLEDYSSAQLLQDVGLDRLKNALTTRGLKCGGTLEQRAERLYSVKGLTKEEIDPKLFAKPARPKKQ